MPVTDASSRYMETAFRPSGASSAWPGASSSRAPMARSAARCVSIVRRAGKSPPGGAMCARPRRASSGPSSRTDPRSRPTSAGSGVVLRHLGAPDSQRARPDAIDLGAEIEQQSRHHFHVADARHVVQDALLLGEQAGGHQRQRRVLVALDLYAAAERLAAFNDQSGHVSLRGRPGTPRDRRSLRAGRRRIAVGRRRGSARSACGCHGQLQRRCSR